MGEQIQHVVMRALPAPHGLPLFLNRGILSSALNFVPLEVITANTSVYHYHYGYSP